jgi:hypothetical protein
VEKAPTPDPASFRRSFGARVFHRKVRPFVPIRTFDPKATEWWGFGGVGSTTLRRASATHVSIWLRMLQRILTERKTRACPDNAKIVVGCCVYRNPHPIRATEAVAEIPAGQKIKNLRGLSVARELESTHSAGLAGLTSKFPNDRPNR